MRSFIGRAFDTAYFAGLPPRAYRYPVPTEWHTQYGILLIGTREDEMIARAAQAWLGR